MKRPRLDLGLEASRPTLNEAECARVGTCLSGARQSRGMSLDTAGGKLLLAPAQVAALEQVRADAFYSAEFYATALRKYAALMGLDPAETARVLVQPAEDARPSSRRGRRSIGASLARVPRPSRRVMVGAGVLVTAVAGGLLVAAVRERTPAKPAPAAAPVAPSTPAALPPSLAPRSVPTRQDSVVHGDDQAAVVPVSTADDPTLGRVRVGRRTWVFVRFATGTTLERVLGEGEELLLADVPTYIAVGHADDTTIEIGGRAIDTDRFTVNGELRVGSSQLSRLVALR
jgi:hypothetical protein